MYEDFLSVRLTQLRMQKGVSARDMSLSLGQANNYINSIENKKMLPSMSAFFYICEYLDVSPQEFFDDGNAFPQRLKALAEAAKSLDDEALATVLDVACKLGRRKP